MMVNKLDGLLEETFNEREDVPFALNQRIKNNIERNEKNMNKLGLKKMLLLSPVTTVVLCLIFAVAVGAAGTAVYNYFFKSIEIPFALEYDITIGEDEKIGWVGEVAGDGDTLHITFSQLDITNPDDTVWGEDMVLIDGAGGKRRFLANSWYRQGNGFRQQFWSGKQIDSDSLSVVKDYTGDILEVVYLEVVFDDFETADKKVISIYTSFSEIDMSENKEGAIYAMPESFIMSDKPNIEGTINVVGKLNY